MNTVVIMLVFLLFGGAEDPVPANPAFAISVNNVQLQPHMMAFTASPGEQVTLSCADSLSWSIPTLALSGTGTEFRFTLPRSHGTYTVTASDTASVQEWIMIIPLDKAQFRTASINSFPVGFYGDGNSRDHLPGRGFIELWPDVFNARISTHLSFSDFLGHTEGGWPQYMVLDLRLVHKLECVLEEIALSYPEARGIHCISGFRTPVYNAAIGNDTGFSLHLYGAASDFWIEGWPANNLIDDLDRNKRIDVFDGEFIVAAARRLEAAGEVAVGGASAYRWITSHGPFVHLDTRGSAAVWQTRRNLVDNPVI
ncbi:MAG: hypothetical protein K8S62_03705 [Candidatus Sabulitectum sp.]|nr:hypothetical protein [Candidatus Sabulitectum sp.]